MKHRIVRMFMALFWSVFVIISAFSFFAAVHASHHVAAAIWAWNYAFGVYQSYQL